MKKKPINNFALKASAIVFAIFLWFYVGAQQDPFETKVVEISVNYQNLNEQLSLTNKIKTVDVTVKGRRSNLASLKADEFTASVDMTNVAIGNNELPIKVTVPKKVDYIGVSPNKIKTYIDKLSEKNVLVQASVIGKTAEGFSSFTPSIKPANIQVQGPESLLSTIDNARVEIDLANTSANLNLNLPVKLYNEAGELIQSNGLEVLPKTVEVFLPVDKDTPSKVVAVKPILVGNPGNGYTISRVVTEPETIKIIGAFNELNQVDQVQTVPIYISNITEDLIQEVELKVPDGVTIMNSNKVKVLISVKEGNMTKNIEVPIKVYNGPDKGQVLLEQQTAQMIIEGKASDLNDLNKINSIIPYVDLNGLEAGSHNVPIAIEGNSGLRVVQITPANVQVVITAPSPEANHIE